MPDPTRLALFVPAALALLVVPGPAVLYVVTRSIQQGRRAGLVSVLGLHTATLVHIAAAAAGLSALLVRSAIAYSIVKYAGAAYLVFLGIRALRSGDDPVEQVRVPATTRRLYVEGFVVNLLNPKTALFFFAFLPQFVDVHRGRVPMQMAILGLLFAFLGLCSDSAYAVLAARLGRRFAASPRFRRRQRRATAGILIGLGATAAVSGSS
jgi:threonine/homoserine/homoserine lactone efflux protein